MEAQELSSQEQEGLAGEVANDLGVSEGQGEMPMESQDTEGTQSGTPHAQKRINARNRERERQMQYIQAKIAELEARMAHPDQMQNDQTMIPHDAGQPAGDMADHIHRAVNQVLARKEEQERRVKQAESEANIQKHYQGLRDHLDNVADKYDDFEEIVRGNDAPFTSHMRDSALLLPQTGPGSAGEVLYKLGKNRSELERISKLHPIEQARELNRLSHALANGSASSQSTNAIRPMGNIKSNPANNSHAITDKTSPAEIRARMKAGKFK